VIAANERALEFQLSEFCDDPLYPLPAPVIEGHHHLAIVVYEHARFDCLTELFFHEQTVHRKLGEMPLMRSICRTWRAFDLCGFRGM
jgi:hypothetical protein